MLPHTQNTYWHEFDEISRYNVALNFFEKLWAAWYAYMGNDILATGVMSFLMHETVYFGRSLPWIIIDKMPSMRKYKIQNVSARGDCGTLVRSGDADRRCSKKFPRTRSSGTARSWSC